MNYPTLFTAALAFCLGSGVAYSHILSPEEALSRLNSAEALKKVKAISETSANATLRHTAPSPDGSAGAYMFTLPDNSYVIVSASDRTEALLGYGTTNDPDAPLPPQMIWWLEEYGRQVACAEISSSMPTPSANSKLASASAIEPLVTSQWNQDAPYNNQCPIQNKERTVTGCVATAIAQVMNYHKYPAAATGEGRAQLNGRTLKRDLNVTFDWNNMLDRYVEGEYSDTEADAVATLMVICGFAVNMMYSPYVSGAYDIDVPKAFVENFGYDLSAWLYYRDFYSSEEWENMLYSELRDNGPIYYSGQSPEGGHAFVCDGYDGDGYFHINWGWGGAYNGYFHIDAFNSEGEGIGGSAGGYALNQVAMLGVRKPVEGTVMPEGRLHMFYDNFDAWIEDGYLYLESGWFNMNYSTVSLYLGVEFENAATGEKELVTDTDEHFEIPPYSGFSTIPVPVPENLGDGEYHVRVITLDTRYEEWLPALSKHNMDDFVTLRIKDGVPEVWNGDNNGVDTIDAAEGEAIQLYFNQSSRSLSAICDRGIDHIEVSALTGRLLRKRNNGHPRTTEISIDLSGINGIVLVTVTDATGHRHIVKQML